MKLRKELLAKREFGLPDSYMADIIKAAEEATGLISLGPGEPDFATPKHVIEFAKKRLDEGMTHYSPPIGRKELREAIAKKVRKENGIKAGPDNVIVTCGSTEAILLALMSLVDVGEDVLVPDPGFLAYKPMVELINGDSTPIRLELEDGFALTPENIKAAIQDPKKTKVMILNTPSNPTGVVYSKKLLEEVADLAIEYDFIILSDEAYEKFVYKGKHVSIGSLNGMEDRVVTLQSFSKTYAMPGFRVGYAIASEKLIGAMKELHLETSICAPTISQEAALAALKGPQGCIKKMRDEYDRRRKLIVRRLREMPWFAFHEPEGAFYAFPKFNFKMSSPEMSNWLVKNAKVITVPGNEFGVYGEGFIRLSYATAYEKIEEAMDRIEKAIRRKKPGKI